MNTKHFYLKFAHIIGLSASILCSANSFGAPLILPSAPLLLSDAVDPNVFFTLDDSGSMDSEAMVPDSPHFTTDNGVVIEGGYYKDYLHPGWNDYLFSGNNFNSRDRNIMPPAAYSNDPSKPFVIRKFWVMQNHEFNELYFNPATRYDPWPGVDSSGNAYPEADRTAIPRDPNIPGGDPVNLTQYHDFFDDITGAGLISGITWLPSYFTATDSNNNGRIDVDDDHTLVEIQVGDTVVIAGETIDGMQNFANWFQYYRKREFSAKAAVGGVINNAQATRMGLDLFNAGTQHAPKSMTSSTDKQTLLNTFYNFSSGGSTPARSAMKRVGMNFADSTSSYIVPQVDGGECQQNFNIVMTDGFWNGSSPSIGNNDISSSGGELDTSIDPPRGFDGNASESNDEGNYEDSYSNTLADVAMYYYETDLSALPDKVPTSSFDSAKHQHLVTYTVSFGVEGTLDPARLPTDPLFTGWPDPTLGNAETIDDLRHAAYNGRGKYLNASNPAELKTALEAAIQNISDRTATAAAVAVNSSQLTENSVIYLAQFNSDGWQGDLLALRISDPDQGPVTVSETSKWGADTGGENGKGANEILTNRDISDTADGNPREIITFNGSAGVPFQWTAGLSTDMLNDLNTSPSGATDANGELRLNYLRGDRSNEGSQFRPRASLLGDIVNSGPVFVGQASLAWPDVEPFPESSKYSDFKNGSSLTRDKVVYVGSNDGMLHAIDDITGNELFAYVPNLLASAGTASGYHYLTDPGYLHNWYVDLTPTVSDVFLPTGGGWQTILIGGLRGGGRGLYALDVTNPDNFKETNAADMVMWEFSSADDNDLGFTYSRPTVALANNGRWVAIFGNGYNDTGDGKAKLFILDIEAGKGGWEAADYKKITTEIGSTTDRNGLANPALVDLDGNGTVDRVYAGDLEGNMWAFDLSDSNPAQWGVAYESGNTPKPLITTPGQPITAKPVLAKHPTIPFSNSPGNAPNLMVYFGTGQYLVDTDKIDTSAQSFYGVWDKGTDSIDWATDLIQQTVTTVAKGRVISRNFVDYSTDFGWWFNLPALGERSVTNSVARTDTVFFNSFVPEEDPCTVGGFGFKFAIDMVTGGSPKEPVVDSDNDGDVDADDVIDGNVIAATEQQGFLPEPVFIEDLVFTGPVPTAVKPLPNIPTGHFSWQELIK